MSDTSQGPGWWLASDGKWYPPELWTGAPGTAPPGASAPSESAGRTQPQWGGTPAYGYGGAPPYPASGGASYHPGGYGSYPGYQRGDMVAPKTNGLAIASLICSCLGLFFLPIIPGIVLGFVARSQIRRSNGTQRGDGLAIAGIIIGFGWVVLFALGIALDAANHNASSVVSAALFGSIS
jgi:hypothetical protein